MGDDGVDTRERIMEATYDALVETGFADLTMSDIAEASETSTSLLHYHFNTKEDLIVSFLEYLVERIEHDIAVSAPSDPVGKIHFILQWYVLDTDEADREALHLALLELRLQASRNHRYRRRIKQADRVIREGLAAAIHDGIESGIFDEVEAEATAALLLCAADGAQTRLLITGESVYTDVVEGSLSEHVLADLFTREALERWRDLTEEA